MAYQSSKHAGLSPITKRHKAGLILLCRRLRRNQRYRRGSPHRAIRSGWAAVNGPTKNENQKDKKSATNSRRDRARILG
jgi:hypothetical protein